MNHQEANKMLDMAREGQPIPDEILAEALNMTGESQHKPPPLNSDLLAYVASMRQAGYL